MKDEEIVFEESTIYNKPLENVLHQALNFNEQFLSYLKDKKAELEQNEKRDRAKWLKNKLNLKATYNCLRVMLVMRQCYSSKCR